MMAEPWTYSASHYTSYYDTITTQDSSVPLKFIILFKNIKVNSSEDL